MNKYLEGEELTEVEIKKAIRKGTILNEINPIFLGSALKNKGVQPLLDAICEYLPSPLDIDDTSATDPEEKEEYSLKAADNEDFSALAFKLATDKFGTLTFFRVYSGVVKKGDTIYNARTGKTERAGRIVLMHSNDRQDVDAVYAGEIAAFVGMKDVRTGDTLSTKDKPLLLETIQFPEPVISLAIEPKTKSDQEKLGLALGKLLAEDPSLKVETNQETGQTVISGMGELHLDIIVDRLKREYDVEANVGAPQVAFKEAIRGTTEIEGKYVKQSGGKGQYGHVWLKIKPLTSEEIEEKGEFEFINSITGGTIPREYIPSVEKGCKEVMDNGALAGFPLMGASVELYDGSFHDVDSSEMSFKLAASMAMKDGLMKCDPVIMEPVMKLEVVVPDEYMGDVIGDLNSRRGQILGSEPRGKSVVVNAEVPLENLFGYISDLRGNTKGQGTASMEFAKYAETPRNVQEKIIADRS